MFSAAAVLVSTWEVDAQSRLSISRRNSGIFSQEWSVENGDSVPLIHLNPITKLSRKKDMRRYARLVRAVRKVYPIAVKAKVVMQECEKNLAQYKTRKQRKKYIAEVQKRLLREYTPVMKKMTIYEGQILLKLIDRQTEYTAYEIVREFRGGFVAGFWQMFAKMFGNNLKLDYDPEGQDRMLDKIVRQYELGLL